MAESSLDSKPEDYNNSKKASLDYMSSHNLARFNLMVTLTDYNIKKRRAEK